ncbi:hypothetical protein I6U48_28855 [Clostridium sp. PL3]|uniref:Uncharacterized protein n=1 Tax=Clostridium thailandense TaxID=2794346 RepID=A0A949TX63_9CLOT|nr:hypothetical protein [Clostridium thailandense]MBV7276882.1 hypothetical protein [Clostridium thailandense]
MSKEKEILMTFDKEKLSDLIIYLMERLEEKEKIQFISKYINLKLALESVGAGHTSKFLMEVKNFCESCLNGDLHVESTYNEYWDSYDEEIFDDCQWAKDFAKYLNITLMHSRNGDYDIAFRAFEDLLNCIYEASSDEEILGTDLPEDYIAVDWNDVFDQYYLCIKKCIEDKVELANEAFEMWLRFGERCTAHMINYIGDLSSIEKVIREKIQEFDNWILQNAAFKLLKGFYEKYNSKFDAVKLAESFVVYNSNFYLEVVDAYVHIENWEKAVENINVAISKVPVEFIQKSLKETLIDCYENLNKIPEAFEVAKKLFYNNPSYDYYKKARVLANKIDALDIFVNEAIKIISTKKRYNVESVLIRIFSYEGLIEELIESVEISYGGSRYEYLKYGLKALVYRGLKDENIELEDLRDFIENIKLCEDEGITDIENSSEDFNKRDLYLSSAGSMLKGMISLHIDAAKRTRYEKAAYYCGVLKDIYTFLEREEEFNTYYDNIMNLNRRRTALKDEMKKRIGR